MCRDWYHDARRPYARGKCITRSVVKTLTDRLGQHQIERDGKYGDIMELCLFNAVLTGVSCDGRSWTYVNQMASSDADPSARSDWFTVACCPPNVLRLLGCIGGYLYQSNAEEKMSQRARIQGLTVPIADVAKFLREEP